MSLELYQSTDFLIASRKTCPLPYAVGAPYSAITKLRKTRSRSLSRFNLDLRAKFSIPRIYSAQCRLSATLSRARAAAPPTQSDYDFLISSSRESDISRILRVHLVCAAGINLTSYFLHAPDAVCVIRYYYYYYLESACMCMSARENQRFLEAFTKRRVV